MDYKEYLDKARIKQLAELQARYNQVYAKERAEAASSLIAGHRQLRRGLQNVGLAGRKGNLISGREKTAALEARRRYREYNAGLSRAANTFTTAAGQRMARQAIDDENRVKRAEAYAKWGDEYAAAKAEAEKEYAAKLEEAKQEHLQYAQEYQNSYNAYLAQQAQYQAWLQQQAAAQAAAQQSAQQELIDPRFQGNNMQQAKQDLMSARAEQQRLQMQQMAQNGVDPRQNAAFNTQQGKVNYVSALAAARQQAVENELRNNDIDPRFAQNSMMQQTKPQASAIAASRRQEAVQAQYEQNLNEWREKIQRAEGITKPKTRNEYDKWHEAQVARQQMIDYERRVTALKYPAISNLITLSDSEFAMRYDAAEKAYKQAVQNAQILRKDSSSSMDDLSSDANDIEAKATTEFVKWQNAARARDDAMGAFYNESVNTNMKLVPHAPTWASEKEHDGKNYTAAMQNHWDATQYARSHDTDGSKYMPLVNEWSFINGRTALNYTQTHAVSNFVNNAASGGVKTQQYNAFVANCAAAFYNQPEGLTKNEREKMEAMLTLANLMTDEERARFNTILRQGGGKEADKYFEYLYASVLPQRFDSYVNNEMEFQTRDGIGKVFESVISIPVNLAQGVSGVIHTLSTGQEDPIAAKLAATKYNLAQGARDAVGQGISSSITNALMNAGTAEDFAQWAGSAGNFLYGTGMSMADSATVAAISAGIGSVFQGAGLAAETASKIGSAIGGSLLGASAFNSSYQEALDNGLDPRKARITAIGNGFNEMLFETLSIGTLLEKTGKSVIKVGKSTFVNWLVNTAVQAGVEGSEEVFTDIANKIWDNRINGIFSEEMQKIREYVASGMSFNEAKEKVRREFAEQLGMSFLGGAISGGFMGGGAQFLGMVQNRQNEKLGKGLRQDSKIMNAINDHQFENEYAQEILKQEKLTNQDVYELYAIMQQELAAKYKADVDQAVKDGKITQEEADLVRKWEENGKQIEKDGKVIGNENGVTAEEFAKVLEILPQMPNANKLKLLSNDQQARLVQAVGGETASIITQSETADREAEQTYRQTVREINNDTTLSPELKQKRLEAAARTRQNARSEASKIADTALTNKKGIGAKLETDGNGTVKVGKGSGKVTYDFSTKDNPGHQTVDSMTATEQSALRIAKIVAASRPDVNVKVEAEFVGEHANENGYYDPNTNTIHINMSGDNSVLWTLSHELTHHLANTDTEAYAALRTAIETALKDSSLTTTQLEERGFEYDLDKVDPYIAREGNLWDALVAFEREEHGYGKDAEEEVVARCCESFLGFNQFVKDFAHKQYKSAKAVNKFIAQMNIDMQRVSEEARENAAQRKIWNDESPENQILRQLTEIDRIANLWRIAVNAEAKKRQAAREETRASTKDSVQMENRINKLREEIASIENDSERLFTNGREFDNARLKKLKNELNAIIEQERKASVKTSLSDILANLDLYRRSDLISMAGQLTQAWDDVDEMTTQELRDGIREIIEEREYTPLELQAKSRGLWVRPATIASTKDSVNRSDAEYLDLARRYESGDKSVEAELRKAVDDAANAAGYTVKAFHGTTENFNVFSRKQQGANHKGYLEFGAGFYFTPSETEAEQWVKRGRSGQDGKTPNVMSVYLNPMRMLSADESVPGGAKYLRTWLSQGEAEFIAARTYRFINYLIEDKGFSNVEAQETLKALGYDAIEATFKNGTEGQYVVFDPSQIKSADLITKDDNGNIIPLSERFKTDRTGEDAWKNEDIRFSLKDNVERKSDLIAVHNLSGDQLLRSIELGGFPMPSIAVMKQSQGHDRYGDVSVIFNKDTIDPKKSTANKVYGGDAWTPTYPTVEYKPRKTVADRIEKTYYDIARKYGYDAARPLYSYVYELERKLNNAGSEKALLDDLYNDIDIMRMYGQINGKNRVEDVYQEKRTEMSASDRAVPEYFIKTLGEKFIKEFGNTSGRAAFEYKKQFVKDHLKELDRALGDYMRQDNIDLEQATYVLENMTTRDYMVTLQRALNIINNNAVKVERIYDRAATEQAIKDSIDEKAYKEWIYDLFHGIIEKSGIRNNKGYYTDSGNQRSWDALHEDETLENVVRVMRDMTDKGSNAFFSQSEMLALGTRNFKSISDIREHKDQLQHISDEEMSAAKTDIVNRFGDLMDEMRDKSESNYFIGRDRALQAMVEAVRKSRTPQGILNELKQWHGLNVTDDMGRRIADLLDEIADLPTEYFEAKPRRAVGIDEIKAVIMPIGEYADLKSRLDERGIPVVEYEKDNAEDRLRALNSDAVSAQRFSKMDKVRLSTADGTRTFTYGDVTAKMYGNDVTLDGGKVRQRVQMLETLAERYDHVTVDASSEAEARAFENAGAKRVADEFSTGNEYGTYEFKFVESQFKRDSQFDAKQKANFAKEVLKQVGSRRNFTDQQMVKYRAALERAMTYLWNSTYGKGDQMAAYDAVDRLFDRILNSYSEMTEADAAMRDALMSQMRKLKTANGRTYYQLDVTETQMSEILNAHDNVKTYTNLLSKALGARVVVKQVDGAKMLENTFTHATDSRIKNDTVEGDMPGELLRLAQKTMEKRTNPYKSESDDRAAKKEAMWDAALNIIGGEKSTQQKIREAVKEARAAERKAAKDKTAKAVDEARLAERMHEGALRAKDRRVMAERESDLKRRSVDREARLKQQFRETTARTNEERLKRIRRDIVAVLKRGNDRIVKLLANPTENSHVPVQLAQAVSEYAQRLNELLTTSVPKSGEFAGMEKQTQKGALNAQKIIDALNRSYADEETIAALKAEDPSFDPRGLLPVQYDENGHIVKDETLVKMIKGMDSIIQGKHLTDLTEDELRFVLNTMRGVIHTVTDANKVTVQGEQRNVYRTSRQMANEVNSAAKVFGDKSNKITKFMNRYVIESLGLRRIAKLYSGSNENAVFVKMVDDLNEGALEQERIKQTLRGMFNAVTTKYAKEMDTWYGKNAEWIDTGFGFKITKGMRVSLAMHILNAQNLRNVEKAGLRIPNMNAYRKGNIKEAYKNGKVFRLTKEQAQQIVDNMTEAEKAYFEVAKEFFHKRSGFYINRTSLKLLGYSKAVVENYFPIQTDDAYRTVKYDDVRQTASVEHPGFLESRKGTANVMYLNDITAVVNRQIDGVAKYAGLAIPMRNWNNIMNAWLFEENEDGEWVRSDDGRAHDVLERRMGYTNTGKAIIDYVDQFITDLTSPGVRDANEKVQAAEFAAKLTSNYVKAVLTLNARVALSQLASVPTAAAEIPWKYIAQSFGGNVEGHLNRNASNDLIDQYTPIFAMRRAGTQTEVSEVMKRKGFADKAEQKLPGLLGWITAMDVAATRRLWYACERWVKGETNIPVGSDAFYKEVAKRYERVIQNTQPNFTVLQRSPVLRSKNAAARLITMFGTQRMQNGGIIIESAAEVVQAKDAATRKSALKRFGRALSGQITAAIVLGLSRAIVAAVRGRMRPLQDDDKDITVGSVSKYIMNEIGTSLAGSFMYVGEIYDFVSGVVGGIVDGDSGYETSFALPAAESLSTIIQFFKEKNWQYFEYMNGDHTDNEKWLKTRSFVNTLMTVASYATGLPLANASKTILNGIVPAGQDIADWIKTGELIPWLHQSGKLDSKKIAANYKAWTKAGYSGRDFFYWEKKLNGVSGGRDGRIPILLDSDLTNEQKALMMQMFDTADGYADGTVFYNKKGEAIIDFTAPSEKQQALPKPSAEPSEAPNAEPTAEPTPKPTENPLTEARQEGVQAAVKLGVPEQTAFDAFLAYQNMGKNKDESDGYSRNDEFREWLFKNVDSPEQRAVLEYQVIGQASSVKGAITYRDSGVVYRDYTNASWFKLSEHNLSKDGTNKRYEAGKQLEKTGLKVDKTVAIYDGLKELTKKAEWIDYLKKQNLNDDQIRIFLWSRGWKY